jgi:hypothetical protein
MYSSKLAITPIPTITADPPTHVFQSISWSVHQNNIPQPTLNQMLALTNWSWNKQKITWSHAQTVSQKAHQKNSMTAM